jgi:hypothetical protein
METDGGRPTFRGKTVQFELDEIEGQIVPRGTI